MLIKGIQRRPNVCLRQLPQGCGPSLLLDPVSELGKNYLSLKVEKKLFRAKGNKIIVGTLSTQNVDHKLFKRSVSPQNVMHIKVALIKTVLGSVLLNG